MIYACILIHIKVDWNETSAANAAEEDDDVDYTNLESGCGGFPWSKMRRADDEEECKVLIAEEEDEEEEAGDDSTDLLIDTQPPTMKSSNNPIISCYCIIIHNCTFGFDDCNDVLLVHLIHCKWNRVC